MFVAIDSIGGLLKEGNLIAVLHDVQAAIRAEPARVTHRVLLAQVYMLQGEWSKAATQLDTLAELDAETLAMVQTCRAALKCEALREEVFAGDRQPVLLGEPLEWIAWLVEALKLNAGGHADKAKAMRDRAFDLAPQASGRINGDAFEWLSDADMRLGPVFEAIINGSYYWIPQERLRRVECEAPADLRDFVWQPATLTLANGGENVALLPARYPGSDKADDSLRLGRRTEWRDIGGDTFVGLGQRMLATSAGDYPLLDVREITFGH